MDGPATSGEPTGGESAGIPQNLPRDVAALADKHLPGEPIVAYSECDVGEDLNYARNHVLLTGKHLLLLTPVSHQLFTLAIVDEAGIEEGVGLDRLRVVVGGKLAGVSRYSRKHRMTMTRLNRKLQRRLPKSDEPLKPGDKPKTDDPPPIWLEDVERKAEAESYCRKCTHLIPSYADGVCPRCLQQRKILFRLLDSAKPYRSAVNFALGLTIVHAMIISVPVVINSRLIDNALAAVNLSNSARMGNLLLYSSLLLLIIALTEVIGGWRQVKLNTIGTQISRDLRHQVYAHLHSLSLRFFNKRRTGSLITRVTNDTDRLQEFIVYGTVNFIRDVLMVVFSAGIMFWLNWRLAIVALLPVPIVATLTYLRGRKMHKAWSRVWNYWSRISAVVGDALPGVRVVKAFSNESREIDRFDKRSNEYMQKEQETNRLWWTLQPIVSGIMRLGGLLVTLIGGLILIFDKSGHTTLGQLLAFSGQVWQFYGPVNELANANRMVTRAASSASRVYEILDTPPDIFDRQGAYKPDKIEGKIEFRNVWFSYEGAQPALRDVSLTIQPGEMVGLCGPSGAGKSTFVNLIPRFYDVTDGQILLDGVDVRDYDVHVLRRAVGMVLQDPHLFHGTISDNIRYGNPTATEAQVITAARAANAHNFIVGFPDGYDTMVGERGQSLSGGERQRVSIARAILHNPKILILDEATSSVDSETEKQIQQALDRLVEGRTTIAIAHRLSTLTAADHLVVLERGKVAETGTLEELSNKQDGVYAKLVNTQRELGSLMAVAG